jgi:hypothetical protein
VAGRVARRSPDGPVGRRRWRAGRRGVPRTGRRADAGGGPAGAAFPGRAGGRTQVAGRPAAGLRSDVGGGAGVQAGVGLAGRPRSNSVPAPGRRNVRNVQPSGALASGRQTLYRIVPCQRMRMCRPRLEVGIGGRSLNICRASRAEDVRPHPPGSDAHSLEHSLLLYLSHAFSGHFRFYVTQATRIVVLVPQLTKCPKDPEDRPAPSTWGAPTDEVSQTPRTPRRAVSTPPAPGPTTPMPISRLHPARYRDAPCCSPP